MLQVHAGWAICVFLVVGQSACSENFLPTWSTMKNASARSWLSYGDTAVFAYGLTVAELRTSAEDGSLVQCNLTELQNPMECDKLVKKIGKPAVNVCLKEIMEIIQQCRALVQTRPLPSLPYNLRPRAFWTELRKGIFPGTKWCGTGDIANGYNDLGSDAALDKCCRAHDHCPVKLKAFRKGHGLVNFSLFTKSHCSCDEDFLQCLLDSESENAAAIGDMYFNILKVPCLREAAGSRPSCKSDLLSVSKECQNEDTSGVVMEFFNAERSFRLPE